jgi:hypothetical protein
MLLKELNGVGVPVQAPSAVNRLKPSPSDKNRRLTARIGHMEHRVNRRCVDSWRSGASKQAKIC